MAKGEVVLAGLGGPQVITAFLAGRRQETKVVLREAL